MKRRLFEVAVLLVAPAAVTCGGLDNFIVEETSRAVIQRGTPLEMLVGSFGFSEFGTLDVTQNQTLANQGVERSQIDSVKIQTITMTIVDPPSGQDFGFIDTMEFLVESPGLPQKTIATGGPFAAGATTVELTIPDEELADYAASESMKITTNATGRRPDADTTIEAKITLDIDVNVDGVVCGG